MREGRGVTLNEKISLVTKSEVQAWDWRWLVKTEEGSKWMRVAGGSGLAAIIAPGE